MENARVPRPVYRRARFADLDDIAALEAEVFNEPYLFLMLRQLFDLHGSEWLVAEMDNAVIGYALTLEKGGRALLFTFAVAKHLQGRGYGRALLERALESCAEIGADVMYLTVRPDNHPASNLFKQAGFVFTEHDDQYFGPGEPRDLFEYKLQGGAGLSAVRSGDSAAP
ncbi:GNAT family N-acetyltransferase [Nocardia sp. NEAU-G5]|uniref:GNAT family N-acetyltransferase n=1 Tax=Nocardia albiluteola TaxID=2842303 RepID=A0ABS6B7R4_9NOCA|nr:GNAT family N-acetyltransferase [Nocardia albiluteola]MBU3065791.1 GNAT family N-acetyltransferase [Nocardia albiluteola]